jgi:hypothetical protein
MWTCATVYATVQPPVADRSRAQLAEAMTRQDRATLQTAHQVTRSTRPGMSTPLKTSLLLLAISTLLYRILSASGPSVGPRVSL